MDVSFCKVPIELCKAVIKDNLLREAQIWLTGVHLYHGKAKTKGETYDRMASYCGVSKRTVIRALKSLEKANWVCKNRLDNWIHFRGKEQIREINNWSYRRCALMSKDDLPRFKALSIGAVISDFIRRNKAARTGCKSRQSVNPWHPVSLSIFKTLFDVSEKTAFNYRKLAVKEQFLKMKPDLKEVKDLSPKDVKRIKQNHINELTVSCFGYREPFTIQSNQLITKWGGVFMQCPNLILPNVMIKKDK